MGRRRCRLCGAGRGEVLLQAWSDGLEEIYRAWVCVRCADGLDGLTLEEVDRRVRQAS